MPLDPDIARILDNAVDALPSGLAGPELIAAARQVHEQKAAALTPPEQRASVGAVSDRTIRGRHGGIPLRVYEPAHSAAPQPVVVWLHGGGWITGSLDTGDTLARAISLALGAVVVSVDYRLAPEHPWPLGLEDSLDALHWTAEHANDLGIDPARIVIGGDSAGGNLAAAIAQAHDRPALAAQLLLYPAVDLDLDAEYPSRTDNATGYGLTLDDAQVSFALYPAGADVRDPRLSPVHATKMDGLPPAVLALAEYDILRDEGYAYADCLTAAGVPTAIHHGLGLVHGCFDMLGSAPATRTELDAVLGSVHDMLARPSE